MSASRIGFVSLYDHEWNALGNWTQHIAKSWSLKRKSQENDEFKCVCQGFENSKNACFVGLHEITGKLKYVAFCGIPKTDDTGFTTITGIDCRSIFNQQLKVDYAELPHSSICTVSDLFQYLMWDVFVDNGWITISSDVVTSNLLGVDYSIDLSDLSLVSTWVEDYIVRAADNRNIYDEILKACACYDLYMETSVSVDSTTNKYKLTFKVKRIYNSRNIKLSDYDVNTKLNQNITNRVVVRASGTYVKTLYLNNDNSITDSYDSSKVLFPPVTETVDKTTSDEATSEAYRILKENRFKDKVTIDLNSKLGSTLEDLDFSYYGNLVGYNPADSSSIKQLPMFSIYTDHTGKKMLEFGRLSDYWFLD